ncbi:HAD family hydrolase [Candidatus Peregrinibacteria bacterium]|nr:HAD family hydrolase [Candidatus Peregrinibacteria bacterium]
MTKTPRPISFHEDAIQFITAYFSIPRALVTNCVGWELDLTLQALPLRQYFDVIVNYEPPLRGKPEGDLYLKAAEILQVSAKKCLIFEDSATGILSGKNAGMTVVAIDRGIHRDFHEADVVVPSFCELMQ